jgi:hypothetical protein
LYSQSLTVAFIRRNINILFIFILPVYLFIVQNSIQNKHTHVYANGIVVTHSHPFNHEDDTPVSDHKHSKTEICLFSCLNFDFYENSRLVELNINLDEIHKNYFVRNEHVESLPSFLKSIPRGPPA